MIRAHLPQILAADIFITGFPVRTGDAAAFIAEEFDLAFLSVRQGGKLIKGLIETKIGNDKAEIRTIQFQTEILKPGEDLGGGGYEVKIGITLLQVLKQKIGMDDDAALNGARVLKRLTETIAAGI